jgi:hypothetical protein
MSFPVRVRKNILIILIVCLLLTIITYFLIFYTTCKEDFSIINDKDGSVTENNIETGKVDRLVVLFSTQYRTWENCAENHINLMKHICNNIDNCIVGIHYWNDINKPPPPVIQNLNIKYSTSDNIISSNDETQSTIYKWFKRFQYSTKIALENAESVYKEKYGAEMPDNQPILRLRPDFIVEDIEKFPLPPSHTENYYISTWNTQHRPEITPNRVEITDICLTNKNTLLKILNFDITSIEHNKKDSFIEIAFYDMLKTLNINIFFDFNIKYGVMRDNNNYDKFA